MEKAKQLFKNKKVLIMGLGTKGGGVASAKFAFKHGASVTITDLNDEDYLENSLEQLDDIPKELVLGKHNFEDFENHDIVIKNPGIKYTNKYIQHAIKHNTTIETPISLFCKLYDKPFIGITGTKGKSYTTALTSHIISGFDKKVIAAGNNCNSPLSYLDEEAPLFVLELSSWQLYEMGIHKKSPKIACWLNFFEDHLNYYNSIDEYFTDKENILKYQNRNDYAVVPFEYTKIRDIQTKSNKILFSKTDLSNYALKSNESICYMKNGAIIYKTHITTQHIINLDKIIAPVAQHQLELLLASTCISICYVKENNFSLNKLKHVLLKQLNTFMGLEHRFETIYKDHKLEIINDSAASTPQSAILAIRSTTYKPVFLIAGGGGGKNLDFNELTNEIVNQNAFVILFKQDEPSEIILELLKSNNYSNYCLVSDMQEAVNQALQIADSKGTILLSPGCSGYPMFKDMFERGNLFKKYMKRHR